MYGFRAIAAAQTIPRRGDVATNVEQHLRLAHAAADANAGVVVFPELSLTGYELDLAHRLAFSERDPRLAPLLEVASQRGITLVVGAPARIGDRVHIAAFVLSPDDGVDLYTKQRLGAFPPDVSPDGVVPPAEWTVFEPGDRNPLIHVDGVPAALAVCADTGRPSHPLAAAERGARTYLASMFFTFGEIETEVARLGAYAAQHKMVVACANYGGPTGGLTAGGSSAIWSDNGDLLARLDATGAGVAVAVEDSTGWDACALMIPSAATLPT